MNTNSISNHLLISYIILSYGRENDLINCLDIIEKYSPSGSYEIIIVDNKGEELVKVSTKKFKHLKYFNPGQNLGVAGGRNFGINKSTGKYLVFIDDDAVFDTPDFMQIILEKFNNNSDVGILAFKALNYYTHMPNIGELPFERAKVKKLMNIECLVSYFVGVGCAFRREMLNDIELYQEDFMYGGEELDLSYRAILMGYKILYIPSVIVLHKKSPVRLFYKDQLYYQLRNRILINARYLPFPYYFTSTGIWSLRFLYEALKGKSVSSFLKGMKDGFRMTKSINKCKLGYKELKYLKANSGRLWY